MDEFEQILGDKRRTVKPNVLQSMGSQRIGHDLETEQQQKEGGDQNDEKNGNSNMRKG